MIEKIGNITLNLDHYPGKDLYSDGNIEDEMVDIAKKYPEEAFPGVIEERGSWPIMYHLSPFRHNIIDWLPFQKTDKVLEIGSGCGAITGAIAEKAGSVTCIDLSKKRSLVNAYRNQRYDNITIVLGNFEEVEPQLDTDYDYVLLIGVFEYGQAYISGADPYERFLQIVNKHRKADGRLVIAIENKFGLKYWAGCREDHLETYFTGLENYQKPGNVRTFTRRGLEEIMKKSGIEQYSFYYPYPDYKFMTTVYSDKRLPGTGELSNNLRNFDQNRMLLFDEKTVFDTILEEKEFPLFSNSYFLLIGKDVECSYAKFSNDRSEEYAIRTEIREEAEGRFVYKIPMTEKAKEHLEEMQESYCALVDRYRGCGFVVQPCEMTEEGALRFPYMEGTSLEKILDDCLEQKDLKSFESYVRTYFEKLSFGEEKDISNYDLIFSNIIIDQKQTWQMIDYEWTYHKCMQAKEIAFRAAYDYVLGSPMRKEYETYLLQDILGISEEEKNTYIMREKDFQKDVTGTRAAMGDMREKIGNVAPDMKVLEEVFLSDYHKYSIQLYDDFGEGFSEENSRFLYNCFQNRKDVSFETLIPAGEKALRIDPACFVCMVKIHKFTINGRQISLEQCVTNGCQVGEDMILFETTDPNITVQTAALLEEKESMLVMDMEVVEMSADMLHELISQKQTPISRIKRKLRRHV